MKCIGPKAKGVDLWMLIWEEVHRILQEILLLEVEHVKAHRSKNEVQEVTLFKHFVTDGNEGTDEMAKIEAMLDGGDMAQIRASTVQQKTEEVCAVFQYAAGFQYLVEE